ncbi:hypothetical protein [Sphingobacterium sp. LRF_L2]|uniref:hypothetical protein n=1 Tax=Sphingobacterium sp. LRF_L2 TaxID=3369421 RepID=UPI003F6434BD
MSFTVKNWRTEKLHTWQRLFIGVSLVVLSLFAMLWSVLDRFTVCSFIAFTVPYLVCFFIWFFAFELIDPYSKPNLLLALPLIFFILLSTSYFVELVHLSRDRFNDE